MNKAQTKRLVVVNDSSVAKGGATGVAVESIRQLRARNVAVVFFCGDDGDNDELKKLGVTIIPLGGERLLTSPGAAMATGIYNGRARRMLRDIIDRFDSPHTVYHVHGWGQILSPSIFAALNPVAARTVITAHDFFLACPNGVYTHFRKNRLCTLKAMSAKCLLTDCDKRNYFHKLWRVARHQSLLTNAKLNSADYKILLTHELMRPILVKNGAPDGKIATLRNPTSIERTERVKAEENREILFIGRMTYEKGPDILAEAAAKVHAPLRFIGDGPELKTVRRLAPHARFDGWLEKTQIQNALSAARLLVMPSRVPETFGLAALEALSAGVPAAITSRAMISQDIERWAMGVSFDVANIDALGDLLTALTHDDAAIRKMSVSAFENASALSPSVEDWTDRLLRVYNERVAQAFMNRPS
jgi:glycosyltransferase involved in cell wall biosynthesis